MFRKNQLVPSLFCGALFLCSNPVFAQGPSGVVSLQNSNPTSSDIIGAFVKKSDSAGDDLPEGLMDGVGEGSSEVSYRGISFSKKTKPEMASTKSLTPVDNNTCPAKNTIAVNVNFKINSAELDDNNMSLLGEISKAMNSEQLTACKFIVEGHTDARGNDDYNMSLSKRRAQEVKNFLANANVKYTRMKAIGKGESELIVADAPNDARNRRVQFRIDN
jgi:outer membrane protein OmpA-like peptidoglycan-associated protein